MSLKEEQKHHLIDLMNQQTLEEAAESRYGTDMDSIKGSKIYDLNADVKRGFVAGAKWMEQRMYSEEEVLKLLITFSDDRTFLKKEVAIQWFEQIKK